MNVASAADRNEGDWRYEEEAALSKIHVSNATLHTNTPKCSSAQLLPLRLMSDICGKWGGGGDS